METKTIKDAYLTGYLFQRGYAVAPVVQGNFVSFRVSGPGLTTAISEFFANSTIQEFIGAYKSVRGLMFAAKEEVRHG